MGSKQSQISVRLPSSLLSKLDSRCLAEEHAGNQTGRQELIQFFVDRHIQLKPPFVKPNSILELRHPLTNIITIALNAETLELIRQEAAEHEVTQSSLIRLCIYEGLST